jgi:hypothetical protein
MHGDAQGPQGTSVPANIKPGDTWLSQELPAIGVNHPGMPSYGGAVDSLRAPS